MLLMELFHACPIPQQVFWDPVLLEMSFLDGTLKQQIPKHLLSKSLWYFQQEQGCSNPLSWLKASRQLLCERAGFLLQSHFCFLSEVTTQ